VGVGPTCGLRVVEKRELSTSGGNRKPISLSQNIYPSHGFKLCRLQHSHCAFNCKASTMLEDKTVLWQTYLQTNVHLKVLMSAIFCFREFRMFPGFCYLGFLWVSCISTSQQMHV